MVDYGTFAKYRTGRDSHSDIGYINGKNLDNERVRRRGIVLRLGEYIQNCPIIKLIHDSNTIMANSGGVIEFNIDFYVKLEFDDEDISDILNSDSWAQLELSLLGVDGVPIAIRKIHDMKVGIGVHRISFHAYIEVCKYDKLQFQLTLLDAGDGIIVDYYNDGNIYTFGTIRMIT